MRIMMHYGKMGLPLDLPDEWDITVIRKKPMPILFDPVMTLKEAFAHPCGCHPLSELAKNHGNACILICDITRPVPNGVILPALIQLLTSSGIQPANITVLVATGLHRPNEGQELLEVVGSEWVMQNVKIENHFANRGKDHIDLGKTQKGTLIKLDRRFVEADLRIVVGLVEPHFMAGYSGGRKLIIPGIAHRETITSIHAASILEQKGVQNCVIEENPLHQEMIEIVKALGKCYAVNVVIDEARKISFVNFGDIEKSHMEAVKFVRPFVEVPITQKFKTVITSGGGYPLDKNYYQTVKGMVAAIDVLEPGGNIFIISECSDGIGSDEYAECQRRLIEIGPEEFMQQILYKTRADIDEWETEMQLKVAKMGKIHLYSSCLRKSDRQLTCVSPVQSMADAIQHSVEYFGDKRVVVIPEGPYVIPKYIAKSRKQIKVH
ncbi:conserved hypothetical protein [uncultured Desulfobacterium sp.]|uniref:Uncharacterized protein n=1 Tax=uncultured Desulfobacterium sp. TaxID=201089 RepID=A0A445N2V4_9BACT|nr:conserved hypothetical protein [uncultured Desulfobacterium sp.]